jgi:hypothetical protein
MHTVKIHIEKDELAPVQRLANELKMSVGDVVYAGLDMLMQHAKEEETIKHIQHSKSGRKETLPRWADRPREIHAYESMT